jgi:hypothetical protein
MSEPGLGSDVSAIKTKATKTDEGYEITGQKMWLTNGGTSTLVATLVKTDEGADSVYRNMTTFLVEKEPGFGETAQGLTEAAVLLGDRQPEDPQLLEAVDDLLRVLVGVLQLRRDRKDLLLDEAAHGLEDLRLVLGQALGFTQSTHGRSFSGHPVARSTGTISRSPRRGRRTRTRAARGGR